jgi:hypothetical protein
LREQLLEVALGPRHLPRAEEELAHERDAERAVVDDRAHEPRLGEPRGAVDADHRAVERQEPAVVRDEDRAPVGRDVLEPVALDPEPPLVEDLEGEVGEERALPLAAERVVAEAAVGDVDPVEQRRALGSLDEAQQRLDPASPGRRHAATVS